jgi:hypothetical protein
MTRTLLAFVFSVLTTAALAQSSPGLQYGQVPTAAQWNSYFANKADYPVSAGVLTGILSLAQGGTSALLTPSAGGIVYSTAGALAILSGTGTAAQCLLSGSNAPPTWGSCSGAAAVSSVTNSDGTLTISPTTGAVIASLALGHANAWSNTTDSTSPGSGSATYAGGVGVAKNLYVGGIINLGGSALRQILTGNTTYYLSPSGNDSNNGTSSGTPWLTCAHAAQFFKDNLDFNGFQVTLQLALGSPGSPTTYTSTSLTNCVFDGPLLGGGNNLTVPIVINGDNTRTSFGSPPNTAIFNTTSGACIVAGNGAVIQVQFFWLKCNINLEAILGGRIYGNNLLDDGVAIGGSIHNLAQQGGYIQLDQANYVAATDGVSDTPDAIYEAKHGGSIRIHGVNGGTGFMQLFDNVSAAIAFAYSEEGGDITVTGDQQNQQWTHHGFDSTGPCYRIQVASGIQWTATSPNTPTTCSTAASPQYNFPGLSPGAQNQGGQFFSATITNDLFTPTLAFGGSSTGITYTTQNGRWALNGNMVVFSIEIILSNKGSATGNATIGGLPLASGAINSPLSVAGLSGLTFTGSVAAVLQQSSSTINLYGVNSGLASLTDTAFSNTTDIVVSGAYPIY